MSDKKECSGEMIPANINDILEELPEDKRKVIVSTMLAIEERSYSGPLPSPEDFKAYEQTLKGSTDRIMSMTEKQVDHRIDMEKTIVKKKFSRARWGRFLPPYSSSSSGLYPIALP